MRQLTNTKTDKCFQIERKTVRGFPQKLAIRLTLSNASRAYEKAAKAIRLSASLRNKNFSTRIPENHRPSERFWIVKRDSGFGHYD